MSDQRLTWPWTGNGFCRADYIGKSDADLVPAERAKIFNAMDRLVFETGRPNVNEEEHTHADGSVRTIRTTKTVFVGQNGANVMVGIFTDLTALRATQRELEAANRRLLDLAHTDSLTGLPNRLAFELALKGRCPASNVTASTFQCFSWT